MNIDLLQAKVKALPAKERTTMREMTKEMKVPQSTIFGSLKKNLMYAVYLL